jgi:hypothetical protein
MRLISPAGQEAEAQLWETAEMGVEMAKRYGGCWRNVTLAGQPFAVPPNIFEVELPPEGVLELDFRSYRVPPKHARGLGGNALEYLLECMKLEDPAREQKKAAKKIKVLKGGFLQVLMGTPIKVKAAVEGGTPCPSPTPSKLTAAKVVLPPLSHVDTQSIRVFQSGPTATTASGDEGGGKAVGDIESAHIESAHIESAAAAEAEKKDDDDDGDDDGDEDGDDEGAACQVRNTTGSFSLLRAVCLDNNLTHEGVMRALDLYGDDSESRLTALGILWTRMVRRSYIVEVMQHLSPEEPVGACSRLGYSIVDITRPSMHYRLDLKVDEERDMCHRLAKLAMNARATCFQNLTIDGNACWPKEDSVLWILQGSPKDGTKPKTVSKFDFVLDDNTRKIASCVFIQSCWRRWAGRRLFKARLANSFGVHVKVHRGANAFKRGAKKG